MPTINPFSSYTFYDAGTIGGERVAQNQQLNETLSERIAAPPHRSDTSATITQENVAPTQTVPAKTVSQSPYDAGAVIGQQLARRASRCYSGVTGVGLPGAGTLAAVVSTPTSPVTSTPTNAVSMSEYVPKRKHRQPTVAARVGEVAPPGGGIAPAPVAAPEPAPIERSATPVRQLARPPTPVASKRKISPESAPVALPTTTRVELPARKSTVVPLNRPSSTSPLNRNTTASPLKRSASGSPLHRAPTAPLPAPPVPRLNSPELEPPVKFFDSPLVNSPMGNSVHPMSPNSPFVASATAPLKISNRSASGYDSDSSHASSSTSSRSRYSQQTSINTGAHTRTDSLGLPSYEKHVRQVI